jgi:pimeloyl-ACP methyl ester carboxylesterase
VPRPHRQLFLLWCSRQIISSISAQGVPRRGQRGCGLRITLPASLGARHITDTNSGHFIQGEQPQLVVEAIREIVDAAQLERSQGMAGNHCQGA